MSTFWLISGASRGLGAALARAAIARGDRVLGLCRGNSAAGETLCWDLRRLDGLAEAVSKPLTEANGADPAPTRWVLVNNAGLLGAVGTRYAAEDIDAVLQVNLAAPILLARCFIDTLAEAAVPKLVLNISSGAASRVINGWSLYCASKAGLEHFGRCLAAEQSQARHPADVASLSPGVIDTAMQAEIRSASAQGFPDRARFVELHQGGQLADPAEVAEAIIQGVAAGRRHVGESLGLAEFAAPQR